MRQILQRLALLHHPSLLSPILALPLPPPPPLLLLLLLLRDLHATIYLDLYLGNSLSPEQTGCPASAKVVPIIND